MTIYAPISVIEFTDALRVANGWDLPLSLTQKFYDYLSEQADELQQVHIVDYIALRCEWRVVNKEEFIEICRVNLYYEGLGDKDDTDSAELVKMPWGDIYDTFTGMGMSAFFGFVYDESHDEALITNDY